MKKLVATFLFAIILTVLVGQPYKNLALEGAGIRGIAYVGVIKLRLVLQFVGDHQTHE